MAAREEAMKSGVMAFALALGLSTVPVFAADTIKIGYIDPLSGGGASVGEVGLKTFQYLADEINAAGGLNGKKVEIVGLDNKVNAQESLIQAQKAADDGIRIITQGNGSSVGVALSDWVSKYNDRNPGNEMIYLNYAAVDPVLTNDKCSYWHFRWDANSDIKMAALTTFMKDRANIKKVYLINQDYSFGQAVRAQARAMLKDKRPDIEIVGDELVPLLKVTDFSPYIAKIKASGADTVITGNWGQDFALLLKAAADAGLQTDWYTYYAGGAGGPTAVKQTGLSGRVFEIVEGIPNAAPPEAQAFETAFRAKTGIGLWYPRVVNEMHMLAKAITQAKADDAKSVAAQLEGMKVEAFDGGDAWMRKDDHQFFQDIYIASLAPLEPGQKFDEEGTGWGWKSVGVVKAADTVLPTTCKMDRP
jgi:branched-chain amino acid transport system substrate-binding protein